MTADVTRSAQNRSHFWLLAVLLAALIIASPVVAQDSSSSQPDDRPVIELSADAGMTYEVGMSVGQEIAITLPDGESVESVRTGNGNISLRMSDNNTLTLMWLSDAGPVATLTIGTDLGRTYTIRFVDRPEED